jgi:hypothetical protein
LNSLPSAGIDGDHGIPAFTLGPVKRLVGTLYKSIPVIHTYVRDRSHSNAAGDVE